MEIEILKLNYKDEVISFHPASTNATVIEVNGKYEIVLTHDSATKLRDWLFSRYPASIAAISD